MFSIGIPAFKGRFLKECINSILSQSFVEFELIIVNDCSPDDIKSIVAQYKDTRIRYYENEVNIGAENVVDNWNKCLSYAKGEFFVLMGDDDKMEVDYLEEFNHLIKKYSSLDVFHCRVKIINENSEEIRLTPLCPEFENTADYILDCIEGRKEQFISDFIFRKDQLLKNGGFFKLPLAWCSDYTSVFIACGVKGLGYTSKPIFCYRQNQFNITSTGSCELKRIATIGMEEWTEKFFKERNNDDNLSRLNNAFNHNKISFIRQMIGREWKGIYLCFLNRKLFQISLRNFFEAFYVSSVKKSKKLFSNY